jgi:hypothetical protein
MADKPVSLLLLTFLSYVTLLCGLANFIGYLIGLINAGKLLGAGAAGNKNTWIALFLNL